MNVKQILNTLISIVCIFICIAPIKHDQTYHLQEKYWVCISPEFNEYQRQAIWDGITIWNSFGKQHFNEEKDGLCNLLIRPVVGDEAVDWELSLKDRYVIGYAHFDSNTIIIFMDKMSSLMKIKTTIAHEGGHWIGLDHIPNNKIAIMNPSGSNYGMYLRLWKADIDEYCNHWNCKNIDIDNVSFDDYNEDFDGGTD